MRASHDRPVNDPLSRAGYVQKDSIDGDPKRLLMAYPGYGRQPAVTPEGAVLGSRAHTQWRQETGVWAHPGIGSPINPRGYQLLVDGRVDLGDGLTSNPPAVGWPMTAAGFGEQFGEAEVASSPLGGVTTWGTAIAWHPSGQAVAIMNRDAFTHVEVWEWVPGVGFGRFIGSLNKQDVDQYVVGIGYDAAYQTPYYDDAGGGMAWSPDGGFLGIAGTGGANSFGDQPFVVFRFSLITGFDWQHPIMAQADLYLIGDGRSIAWSQDGAYVAVGGQQSPYLKVFPWRPAYAVSGGAIGTELSDPATIPAGPVWNVAWTPDGSYITTTSKVSGSGNKMLRAWPWSAGFGTVVPNYAWALYDEPQALSWHPDGLHVLVSNISDAGAGFDFALWVVTFNPAAGGSWTSRYRVADLTDWNSILGASFSSDGSMIVAIGEDGGVPQARLWTYSGGVATQIASTSWTGMQPFENASVAWRPPAVA